MADHNLFNTLEIPGSFLVPGFSIYVLEISRGFDKSPLVTTQPPSKKVVEFSEQSEESIETTGRKQKWFYIGMTGDPHYPSARSAYYRLVGHLELNKRSTQNQLRIAMKEKLGIISDDDFRNITLKMHHYQIPGFKRLVDKLSDKEAVKRLKKTPAYKEYKETQQKVLTLENALIFELKDKLLNKTIGKNIKQETIPFPEIYKSIIQLVNNGLALSLSKGEL